MVGGRVKMPLVNFLYVAWFRHDVTPVGEVRPMHVGYQCQV